MTVRDAKKHPPLNSSDESWRQWLSETVWEKLNVDAYKVLATPAASDKVLLFDNSADAARGITLTNLFDQTLLMTALGLEYSTWTPVLGGSGGSGTHTYATQIGRYAYCGAIKRCWAEFILDITTKDASGTTSGNLQITALPKTIANVTNYRPVCTLEIETIDLNVAGGYYSAVGLGVANTTTIGLFEQGDNVARAALAAADFANGSAIRGFISYETT